MSFKIIDEEVTVGQIIRARHAHANAPAVKKQSQSPYYRILSVIDPSFKNEEGKYMGMAIMLNNFKQVSSLRNAARLLGVHILARRQKNGKLMCWKLGGQKPRPSTEKAYA